MHELGGQLEKGFADGFGVHHVFWEIVETKAVPIPGTERPLSEVDRIPGVIDPDDGLT